MFETFEFETLTAPQASVYFALVIGALFGVLAQITKFCFRRALVGEDRRAAAGVWFTALAVAVVGTQAAVAAEWITFEEHRFMISELPIAAIAIGGLLFGAGMVLTRGCASRLTVLAGSGNLRAALVLVVLAIVAHMTLKGVLSPVRTALGSFTLDLGDTVSLAALPGGTWFWTVLIAVLAIALAYRSGNRTSSLILAALIGLLVPAAWVGTGFILYDDFDPIAMESLSFTAPAADTLFWSIASTAISPNFGTGLIGGVVIGALAASLIFGGFQWQSFESPRQTGRYVLGASFMGMGGVLAGGCTLGAGLSGVPSLSIAAIFAIVMIAAGAKLMQALLNQDVYANAAPSATHRLQPAE
jgi:uncharacterized membrane protein YedE/YeeE